MLYALMWILIGFVIGIFTVSLIRVTPKEVGYTQTYIRGDCRDTITFNPTETIITIQVDWDRYDPFDPHMGAISNLISIAYQGDDGTPMKYLKECERSEVLKTQQRDDANQTIEHLRKERNKIIDERDSIELKYRKLKDIVREQNKFIAPLLDEPEERFHYDPPF